MIVGCYVLHLYCDYVLCLRHVETTGHTEGQAKREAKSRGWTLEDERAFCPKHEEEKPRNLRGKPGRA